LVFPYWLHFSKSKLSGENLGEYRYFADKIFFLLGLRYSIYCIITVLWGMLIRIPAYISYFVFSTFCRILGLFSPRTMWYLVLWRVRGSIYADVIYIRSFYLALGGPLLQIFSSHSPLCITTQMTDCYWSEESFTSLIGQITIWEKSSGQNDLLHIRTTQAMNKTSGQTQVKLSLLRGITRKLDHCSVYQTSLQDSFATMTRRWYFF
jgi:hypothetical protein